MASPTFIQAANAVRGAATAQTGINLGDYSQNHQDPMDFLRDRFGGRIGFAHDYDPSIEISISGETNTAAFATGVFGASYGAAVTVANKFFGYGTATGDAYMTDLSINQPRDGFANADISLLIVDALTTA